MTVDFKTLYPLLNYCYPPITPELRDAIAALILLDTVKSVSCCAYDVELWQIFVAEQLARSHRLGVHNQAAFTLSGPDDGLPRELAVKDWGGCVHIPYEGACEGDLFFLPRWFNFRPDRAESTGRLRGALWGKHANYVVSARDWGEVAGATRKVIGDWVIYTDRNPYVPEHALGHDWPDRRGEPVMADPGEDISGPFSGIPTC